MDELGFCRSQWEGSPTMMVDTAEQRRVGALAILGIAILSISFRGCGRPSETNKRANKVTKMPLSLRSLEIVGIHSVVPAEKEFREAVAIQWGDNLSGERLKRAESEVRKHFANLYLLEIKVEPPDAEVDWMAITQPIDGQPQANWQVPYDERRLGEPEGHWAFFFHFLNRNRPLKTQLGDRTLPAPTPMPPHLQSTVYEVPG
jgi:hypothetical protein